MVLNCGHVTKANLNLIFFFFFLQRGTFTLTYIDIYFIVAPYRVCLILAAVELMTVIKDVLVGGVQTGFDTILDNLTGSGWRLKLLDLNTNTKRVRNLQFEEIVDNVHCILYVCHIEKNYSLEYVVCVKKSLKEGRRRDCTFILKKVILVRRSTVDLRSCSLSGLLAGKLFCSQAKRKTLRHYR